MPTLAVGMLETRENCDMPTASVGMAPLSQPKIGFTRDTRLGHQALGKGMIMAGNFRRILE